jgi:hypothetical protein
MRNAIPGDPAGPARHGFMCAACGRLIITAVEGLFCNPARGSARRFCTPSCRQAARRRRRAGAAEDAPLQYAGGRARSLAPGGHGSTPGDGGDR